MAANAAHRGYIGAIVFLPALLVWSAVLGRLWLDYYRVGMQQPMHPKAGVDVQTSCL